MQAPAILFSFKRIGSICVAFAIFGIFLNWCIHSSAMTEFLTWMSSDSAYNTFITSSKNAGISDDICSEIQLEQPVFRWSRHMELISSHAGKDLVVPVLHKGISAVLKVKDLNLRLDSIAVTIKGTDVSSFDYLTQYLLGNYGTGVPKAFLGKFRDADLDQLEVSYRRCQQSEFVFLSLLPYMDFNSSNFPQLIGTCGDGYFVQQTVPVMSENFVLNLTESDAGQVGDGFLQLIRELHRNSLQICDVKLDNFAWNWESLAVKLIDWDSVFFEESLVGQFDGRICNEDADCDIFDCRGMCNSTSQTCLMKIEDSNLARICRKIFLPGFWQKSVFSAGELMRRPKLLTLLRLCGQSGMVDEEWLLSSLNEQLLI